MWLKAKFLAWGLKLQECVEGMGVNLFNVVNKQQFMSLSHAGSW